MDRLANDKADKALSDQFREVTEKDIKRLTEEFVFCANLSRNCANYLEKYIPLSVQRQITEIFDYVFTDRQIKWRVNWFNEVKIPMLTAALLTDSG